MATKVLRVVIAGDAKGALKSFDDVERGSAKMGSGVAAQATKIASAAKAAALGFAAVGVAAAAIAIKASATFEKVGLETGKLQRYTGDTAQNMSRLRAAFQLTGIDTDKATKAMGLFSKSIVTGKLAGYGIAVKDVHGKMPMNTILMKTADHFAIAPNGPQKTAAALKLFGKAGADLLPFLNRGAAGIAELEKSSDKLGTTLGEKDVKAAKTAVIEHRKFELGLQGLQIQIGRYVLPVLNKMMTFIGDKMPKVISFVKDKIEDFKKKWAEWQPTIERIKATVQNFVDKFMGFIGKLTSWWKDHWDQIKTSVTTALNIIKGYISTVVTVITFIWRNFGQQILGLVTTVWNAVKGIIHAQLNVVMGIIRAVMALIRGDWGKAWDGIKQALSGVWEWIKSIVRLALGALKNILTAEFNVIKGVVTGAWDKIKGVFSAAWDGIKTVVTTGIKKVAEFFSDFPGKIIRAIGNVGRTLWGIGGDLISGLYNGITDALKNVWKLLSELPGKVMGLVKKAIPGAGVVGDLLGHIPGLAGGAQNYAGGLTIVGEKGPELVHLPRGSDVYTASETRGMMGAKGAPRAKAGGGHTTVINVNGSVLSDRDLVEVIARAKRRGLMPA